MKKVFFTLIFIFSSFSLFCNPKEKRYISVPDTELKESSSVFSSNVASTNYGELVTILKEEKKWTLVQKNNGKSGWLPNSVLTKKKIIAKGSVDLKPEELALSGKGFGDEEETAYKKNAPVNYGAVDEMEKNTVSNSELMDFLLSGELNVE